MALYAEREEMGSFHWYTGLFLIPFRIKTFATTDKGHGKQHQHGGYLQLHFLKSTLLKRRKRVLGDLYISDLSLRDFLIANDAVKKIPPTLLPFHHSPG